MICPQCKNEKWNDNACPHCGLGEKEALLSAGEGFQKTGRMPQAIECYEKYLKLEPVDFKVECLKAKALCLEAVSTKNPTLFKSADDYVSKLLEKHWDWEEGYQQRVNLFYCFGKLEELETEYRLRLEKTPLGRDINQRVIEIIHLTQKFRENPPPFSEPILPDEVPSLWSKDFLPLLVGLPLVLGMAYGVSKFLDVKERNSVFLFFFVFLVSGLIIVALFFLSMNLYRKNRKKPKGGKNLG